MEFLKEGKHIRFGGLIRLALVVVFLLVHREGRDLWMIFAFGILFLISGLVTFILGPAKRKSVIIGTKNNPFFFPELLL